MKTIQFVFLVLGVLGVCQWCAAQDDSPAEAGKPSIQDVSAPIEQASLAEVLLNPPIAPATKISEKGFYWDGWKQLGPNVVRDQKAIYLLPLSLGRGKYLKPTLALAGITAAIVLTDKYSAGYFTRTSSLSAFNRTFSGPNTAHATEIVPAALYVIGLARRDKYAQQTFFLAARAVIDSEILTSAMKDIDRRAVPDNGNYSDTWFDKRDGGYLGGKGSFPSGHTIAAFAVATAYAERYPNPAWHKWVAYGLAGLVGFSRVSLHAHYASDVVAGAALGYLITRYIVLRHPCGEYNGCN